jgi:hypothetical protein
MAVALHCPREPGVAVSGTLEMLQCVISGAMTAMMHQSGNNINQNQ